MPTETTLLILNFLIPVVVVVLVSPPLAEVFTTEVLLSPVFKIAFMGPRDAGRSFKGVFNPEGFEEDPGIAAGLNLPRPLDAEKAAVSSWFTVAIFFISGGFEADIFVCCETAGLGSVAILIICSLCRRPSYLGQNNNDENLDQLSKRESFVEQSGAYLQLFGVLFEVLLGQDFVGFIVRLVAVLLSRLLDHQLVHHLNLLL